MQERIKRAFLSRFVIARILVQSNPAKACNLNHYTPNTIHTRRRQNYIIDESYFTIRSYSLLIPIYHIFV